MKSVVIALLLAGLTAPVAASPSMNSRGDDMSIGNDQEQQSPGGLGFCEALASMKVGKAVRRMSWHSKTVYVALKSPKPSSDMSVPYVYMHTEHGNRVPWQFSQTDLFAEDWEIL